MSFLVLHHLAGEKAGCVLNLISHRRCCHCLTLPRGAMVWYVVCDCGISWPHSLTLTIEEAKSAIMNIFRKKNNFLFKSFVKAELS